MKLELKNPVPPREARKAGREVLAELERIKARGETLPHGIGGLVMSIAKPGSGGMTFGMAPRLMELLRMKIEYLTRGELGTVLGWETITNATIDDQIALLRSVCTD